MQVRLFTPFCLWISFVICQDRGTTALNGKPRPALALSRHFRVRAFASRFYYTADTAPLSRPKISTATGKAKMTELDGGWLWRRRRQKRAKVRLPKKAWVASAGKGGV